LLILAALFGWLNLMTRRVFILDFRDPEPLGSIDKDWLGHRIRNELQGTSKRLDRLMIFAHPQSGTGWALTDVVADLKKSHLLPTDIAIVDFCQLAGSDECNTATFRGGVVSISAKTQIAIFDNFEVRLTEKENRLAKLALLEAVVYDHRCSLYILTSSDPLLLVESLLAQGGHNKELQPEMDRWVRILSNFERYSFWDESSRTDLANSTERVREQSKLVRIDEAKREELCCIFEEEISPTLFLKRCGATLDLKKLDFRSPHSFEESIIGLLRERTDGYYRLIWLNCTSDERLALYQLAKDGWLNPWNKVAISHLLRKQLISKVKDGPYRLMNLSFRSFVLQTVSEHELATWRRQQNLRLWPALRMALIMAAVLVLLFVFYVDRDIFDVYFNYAAALVGGGLHWCD
jgi:hypothetical protein